MPLHADLTAILSSRMSLSMCVKGRDQIRGLYGGEEDLSTPSIGARGLIRL